MTANRSRISKSVAALTIVGALTMGAAAPAYASGLPDGADPDIDGSSIPVAVDGGAGDGVTAPDSPGMSIPTDGSTDGVTAPAPMGPSAPLGDDPITSTSPATSTSTSPDSSTSTSPATSSPTTPSTSTSTSPTTSTSTSPSSSTSTTLATPAASTAAPVGSLVRGGLSSSFSAPKMALNTQTLSATLSILGAPGDVAGVRLESYVVQSDGTEYLNGWSTAIVDTLPGYPMNITAGRFETVYHNLTDGFLKYRLVYLDNGFNEIQATDLSEGMTEIVSSRFAFDQPATSSATDEIKPSVNIRMTANPTMQGQFAAFFAPEGTDITSVTAPTWTSLFFPAGSLGLRVSADGFTPGQAGTIRWVYNEVSFGSNTSTEAGTTVITAAVVTPTTPTTPGPDVTTPGDVDAPVIITPAIVDAPVAAPVKTTSEKHLASTGADASPLTVMAGLMLLIGAALARFRRRVAR